MSHFHQRPERRRQRSLAAKALVLGQPAAAILHQGRTAHLLPVKSTDHRGRYAVGMRLGVKEMVPGPTACHVIVTAVHGPREAFTLGDVTYPIARELGHMHLSAFWRYWLVNHDQAWIGRAIEAETDTDEEIARRFESRWAGKLAWLIRFRVDREAPPRLLAARSDELYVENDAMALHGEMPALSEEEWKTHIGPDSAFRRAQRERERKAWRESQLWENRLVAAKAAAKAKGYDVRDEVRRFERLMGQGKIEKAMRQLELLEARVFPVAA